MTVLKLVVHANQPPVALAAACSHQEEARRSKTPVEMMLWSDPLNMGSLLVASQRVEIFCS